MLFTQIHTLLSLKYLTSHLGFSCSSHFYVLAICLVFPTSIVVRQMCVFIGSLPIQLFLSGGLPKSLYIRPRAGFWIAKAGGLSAFDYQLISFLSLFFQCRTPFT